MVVVVIATVTVGHPIRPVARHHIDVNPESVVVGGEAAISVADLLRPRVRTLEVGVAVEVKNLKQRRRGDVGTMLVVTTVPPARDLLQRKKKKESHELNTPVTSPTRPHPRKVVADVAVTGTVRMWTMNERRVITERRGAAVVIGTGIVVASEVGNIREDIIVTVLRIDQIMHATKINERHTGLVPIQVVTIIRHHQLRRPIHQPHLRLHPRLRI